MSASPTSVESTAAMKSSAAGMAVMFGGILLNCAAIAYRGLQKGAMSGTKGILLSLLCGVVK